MDLEIEFKELISYLEKTYNISDYLQDGLYIIYSDLRINNDVEYCQESIEELLIEKVETIYQWFEEWKLENNFNDIDIGGDNIDKLYAAYILDDEQEIINIKNQTIEFLNNLEND